MATIEFTAAELAAIRGDAAQTDGLARYFAFEAGANPRMDDPALPQWQHASDCATHNGPALPAGPCDCGQDIERDAADVFRAIWPLSNPLAGFPSPPAGLLSEIELSDSVGGVWLRLAAKAFYSTCYLQVLLARRDREAADLRRERDAALALHAKVEATKLALHAKSQAQADRIGAVEMENYALRNRKMARRWGV